MNDYVLPRFEPPRAPNSELVEIRGLSPELAAELKKQLRKLEEYKRGAINIIQKRPRKTRPHRPRHTPNPLGKDSYAAYMVTHDTASLFLGMNSNAAIVSIVIVAAITVSIARIVGLLEKMQKDASKSGRSFQFKVVANHEGLSIRAKTKAQKKRSVDAGRTTPATTKKGTRKLR